MSYHPQIQQLLQYFDYEHEIVEFQEAGRPFQELAHALADHIHGPECAVALRKLLESKDAVFRAILIDHRRKKKEK